MWSTADDVIVHLRGPLPWHAGRQEQAGKQATCKWSISGTFMGYTEKVRTGVIVIRIYMLPSFYIRTID